MEHLSKLFNLKDGNKEREIELKRSLVSYVFLLIC